ncbi:E3 ubiquitin ligase [Acrasis kona]|uniref:E3 ubiquitin ligase n=1 Tax=Acrasis kona TaxID=1008807 RepID=A0AAW2Z0J1_9EUKA
MENVQTPTVVRNRRRTHVTPIRPAVARTEQVVIEDSPPPRRRIIRRRNSNPSSTEARGAQTSNRTARPHPPADNNQSTNRNQPRNVINLVTPPQPARARTIPTASPITFDPTYHHNEESNDEDDGAQNPIHVDDDHFIPRPLIFEEDDDDHHHYDHDIDEVHTYDVDEDDDDEVNHHEEHDPQEDLRSVLSNLQREEAAETEQERSDRDLARRLQMEETMLAAYQPMRGNVRANFHPGQVRHVHPFLNFHREVDQNEFVNQQEHRIHNIDIRRRMFEALNRINQNEPIHGTIIQSRNPLSNLHFVDRDFDERDYEMLLQLDDQVPNRHKADVKLVNKVPVKEVKAGEVFDRCSVCLCDLEVGEMRKELPCEHGFHDQCIDKWLKDYNEICPICKKSLSEMQTQVDKKRKRERKSKKNKRRKNNSGAAVQVEGRSRQ